MLYPECGMMVFFTVQLGCISIHPRVYETSRVHGVLY